MAKKTLVKTKTINLKGVAAKTVILIGVSVILGAVLTYFLGATVK